MRPDWRSILVAGKNSLVEEGCITDYLRDAPQAKLLFAGNDEAEKLDRVREVVPVQNVRIAIIVDDNFIDRK